MSRTLPLGIAPEWDRDFTVMVGVSALLHAAVAALVVFLITLAPAPLPPLQSYTVELTDPSALGGRLAFGPLDRPLGRPARIAPASGGAAEGPPRTGEPAAVAPPEPPKPVKVAEAPPPTAPPATVAPATLPPKPAAPPEAVAVPKAVEAPKPVEKPKPVEIIKPTPVEPPKPKPLEAAKPKPVEAAKPPPAATPLEAATVKAKTPQPKPPEPQPMPEKVQAMAQQPKLQPKPEPAKVQASTPPKPSESAVAPSVPAAPMKANEARPATVKPGEAKTPPPAAPATGTAGTGTGGSAEEKVDEKFAAAAEHWRSRMASGGGGLDGAEAEHGPIGEGTPGAGGGGTVVGTEFLAYRQRIFSIIKTNWVQADRKSKLVAQVRFELTPEGEVGNVRLERSSGDKAYDLSVLRAVERSSPLPPPPEKHRDDFHEVVIEFHSEEGGHEAG
jgi:colicin import membrane protein